jgi:hypothetical protein
MFYYEREALPGNGDYYQASPLTSYAASSSDRIGRAGRVTT